MTNPELSILNFIEQNERATQREMAEQVGVSLGTVNILLKRMIRTGWVKVERLQANSLKYFLTPSGIASKVERTYGYVVRTYQEINRLRARIVTVTNAVAKVNHAEHICFLGEGDELSEMVHDLIRTRVFTTSCHLYKTIEELMECTYYKSSIPVIIWNSSTEELLKKHNISCVNMMGMVEI